MTKKLALFFIVGISALILVLAYNNSTRKTAETQSFEAFPDGDFYGSMETKEVVRIIQAIQDDSLVEAFPFSLTMMEGFLNTLQESGIDPSTAYLVINTIEGAVHLFLTINDPKKATDYLEEYAYLFDFESDTASGILHYSYDKLTFSADNSWLKIKYTDPLFFADLEAPVPKSVHPIDAAIFEKRNQFHYSSSITDSLGIEKLVLTQAVSEKGFQWLIQLDAKGVFPYKFSAERFPSYTFGDSSRRISVSVEPINAGFSHPLRKKLSRLFMDYGLNEQNILNHWGGGLTFELGPEIEHVDTIITTTFDEEFIPIQEYRVRRKMKPSYLVFLRSEEPEQLLKALNKNNFFQTNNRITRLPSGNLTSTDFSENGILFTSLNAQNTASIQSTANILCFSWNELVVRLQLKESSTTQNSFILNIGLPSQGRLDPKKIN